MSATFDPPPGPKGQTVVIAPNVWGAGASLEEAKRNVKRHGGRLNAGYTVLVFDNDTQWLGINDVGTAFWKGNRPTITEYSANGRPVASKENAK